MLKVNKLQSAVSPGGTCAERCNGGLRLGCAFLWCAALLSPGFALAEAWTVTPELNLRSGYDDNIRLRPEGTVGGEEGAIEIKENGGIETNASVALEVATLTAISELRAKARADFISYSQEKEEDIDNEDNQYIDVSGRYSLTPINDVGIRFSMERKYTGTDDDRRDFFSGITDDSPEDPPEADVNSNADIGVTRLQVRRERIQAEPYWSIGLTESTRLKLQYLYDDTSYGSDADLARLFDFTRQRASVKLERSFSQTSRAFVSLDGGTYESADRSVLVLNDTSGELETRELNGRKTDEIAARFGYRHNVSPISIVGFNLGARRLSFNNSSTAEGVDEDDNLGAIVRIFGEHRGELTRYAASIGRTITPSGTGALVESDIFEFNFVRSLSPRFAFQFESEYFGNSSIGGTGDARADRDYVRVAPMLRWNWTPEWSVNLIYEYEWEDRDIDDLGSADSNGAFISIIYRKDNEIGQKTGR